MLSEKAFFKIRPVLVGEFGPVREDVKFRGGNPSEGNVVPSYLFYLESKEHRVVVDTGFDFSKIPPRLANLQYKGRDISQVLEEEGIDPKAVDFVICTHLHWDHVGNVRVFERAKVVCQRSEVAWALLPPFWEIGYEKEPLESLWKAIDRLVVIDGEAVLARGLSVRKVGGHTPGSQVVEAETVTGKVIIAGDLVMCLENFEKDWPIGLFWSLPECIEGMKWLKRQEALVLPGHDWKVLSMGSIG